MPTRSSLAIAFRALRRNRLQTSLTIVGMTIGVAAVLAMIAIGTGAETAIEDQIRAAGMNLIVVTAGNYKMKATDDFGGGAVEPSAALGHAGEPTVRTAIWNPDRPALVHLAFHPEDDPMEKHDHPTARQRLGDSEAGLGSAATLTAADADAIRGIRGVQYVAEGLHQNVHVRAGDTRWFTRLHGTDLQLPLIRRAWTIRSGRFFNAGEQSRADQVMVLGSVAAQRVFGDAYPVGRDVTIWNQPFR
ncbi:MAG TPA: ABC transporter permease, partial [Vicinamibacterales bacterium]|nr:ABC transporter permease [Vicinamibacterales bacterium]